MYINKNQSIRKGFCFSNKKFLVTLTLSSGLLVQLMGCNAHQGKDRFIAIPKAEALGKVSGVSYKEISNYQSCCDARPGQSVINDINHIGNILYKKAYKLNVNSSVNKKVDIHKETEGLLERIKVALHAKLKEQAKLIEEENKLILEEQTKLISFFRNLYGGVTLIIQNRELGNNKTQKTKNEYERILIDNLYKVCQDDDNFYQAFEICMNSKSMKNNNDKEKLLYNIYQILYKKVYGDNAGSNINKDLESLLTDIQCLTQIGLHNLPKSNSLIERKNKINGFLEYSKQLLDYPIDKQDYFSWVLSRNDIYDTLMMTNFSSEPKRNRKGKLLNKIRCILGKKCKKFDPRSAMPVDKRSDKFAFSHTEYGTDLGNIPLHRESDEPSSSNTEYDSGYDTDSGETFF